MVHKSSIIPGLSRFLDENVLSHYPPTSLKRVVIAGLTSIYLKQNEKVVDALISNPMFATLGVSNNNGMIDIETLRDTLKSEVSKAGFVRISFPVMGDIDFTTDDVDALYRFITESNTQVDTGHPVQTAINPTSYNSSAGGIY